ncbi:MAG: hypothetical protein IPL79_15040 [Myxococcales bacterium]|nr:hypothetical protein [Myxococcales bacterium]
MNTSPRLVQISTALLLVASASLMACGDEHAHGGAEIAFAAPLDGAVVAVGAEVMIEATVTAEESMHGWMVEVRNHADDTVLATFDAHDHTAAYDIAEVWTADVASGTEVDIEVIVTVDHDGALETKLVTITVE